MTKIQKIPYCDPLSLFQQWQDQPWALLFDSAQYHEHHGRYSYIAVDPFSTIWIKEGRLSGDPTGEAVDPFHVLKTFLNQMPAPYHPELPPFQGGAAGAFAYDLHQYIEPIPTNAVDELHFPDMAIGFYDVVISFDALQKKAWIVSTGWPEKTEEKRLARATDRLKQFIGQIANTADDALDRQADITEKTPISSNFNATTYMNAVNRVMDYILAGDIFEANISQCFTSTLPVGMSPFSLYQRLREKNPAPFSTFMNLGDTYVVSASPERFLQLNQGLVEARPIKGTRRRDSDPTRDQQLATELQSSEKDIAENVMIVDLLRNDLSKVCKDHSVKVTQLCGLESYATVHHLVSVITGELKDNHNAVDLFISAFPGGSITGAPKVRAMQIIADIEPTKRGLYCGSLGFVGFNGAMDMSIAIRTFTIKNDMLTFQAGGAVVLDSDPLEEYQETLTKSSALRDALVNPP